MSYDRFDNRPHIWIDVQSCDRIIDIVRLLPTNILAVVSQKMNKLQDGKQDIYYRCKFFFAEQNATSYIKHLQELHDLKRIRIIRKMFLCGGWKCPKTQLDAIS